MSAWNASTCRSNISSAYSLNVSGTPPGRSGTANSRSAPRAAAMRRSTSRMASRYSLSLTPSRGPELRLRSCEISWSRASRMLRSSWLRAAARFGGVAAAEQPLEHEARIGLHRQRHRRVLPRHASSCTRRRSRGRRRRRRRSGRRRLRATAVWSRWQMLLRDQSDRSSCRPARRRLRSASGEHAAHERRRRAWMLPPGVALVRRRQVVEPGQDDVRSRNGSSGFKVGESSNRAPSVAGVQSLMLAPLPHVDRRRTGAPASQVVLRGGHRRHHRVEERQRQGSPFRAGTCAGATPSW